MPEKTKKIIINRGEGDAIDLSGLGRRCLKPCYISQHMVEENKGGSGNTFYWQFNVGGYPIVNLAVQLRGEEGKPFQVQVRHAHPSDTMGPTVKFVIARETGNISHAGFKLVTFSGLRPLLPELDIVAFSEDGNNFDVVVATVYATVA